MKKICFMLSVLAACSAFAATPFRETVTITAGSGVYTNTRDFVARKIVSIGTDAEAATTSTYYVVQGTITNDLDSIVLGATDRTYFATNDVWLFKGDKILITAGDTNTHYVTIIGTQEP